MAKTYNNTNNSLEKNFEKQKMVTLLEIAASFGILMAMQAAASAGQLNYIVTLIGIAVIIALFYAFHKSYGKYNIYKTGLAGEQNTAGTLSTLPETYSVITNAEITAAGSKSELDFVVIGPNGVFIVENKAHIGTISGNTSDENLTQMKDDIPEHARTFYNPIKQVSTHTHRLSQLLKENGIDEYISPIVYFSSPESHLAIMNDNDCKVQYYSAANTNINSVILNAASEHIDSETVDKIRAVICNNVISTINNSRGSFAKNT